MELQSSAVREQFKNFVDFFLPDFQDFLVRNPGNKILQKNTPLCVYRISRTVTQRFLTFLNISFIILYELLLFEI